MVFQYLHLRKIGYYILSALTLWLCYHKHWYHAAGIIEGITFLITILLWQHRNKI